MKNNNPAQIVVKLLMNSMCDKIIMRAVETDTVVKDNRDDFEKYISYSYSYIDSVIEVTCKFYIIKRLTQSYHILIMSIAVLIF